MNRNTVALAYRRLVEAGVAETRGRGGTVVAAVPQLAREGVGVGADCVDLASGNPDPSLLPDILAAAHSGSYGRPLYGAPALDAGLDAWARADFAEDIDHAFRTLVTHGAVDATERLLNAHLTRGDLVAIEDPCFLASIGTLRLNGYRSAPVRVDGAGMRPDALRAALEAGARAVVCTPAPTTRPVPVSPRNGPPTCARYWPSIPRFWSSRTTTSRRSPRARTTASHHRAAHAGRWSGPFPSSSGLIYVSPSSPPTPKPPRAWRHGSAPAPPGSATCCNTPHANSCWTPASTNSTNGPASSTPDAAPCSSAVSAPTASTSRTSLTG